MPIYEWRCSQCGMITELERKVDDRNIPPDAGDERHKLDCRGERELRRIISASTSTPFETLRDKGVFERLDHRYNHN